MWKILTSYLNTYIKRFKLILSALAAKFDKFFTRQAKRDQKQAKLDGKISVTSRKFSPMLSQIQARGRAVRAFRF